jgi:HK97 family phage prohead protease
VADLTPTEAMAEEAAKGLRWHAEGLSGDGIVETTLTWARRIAARSELSEDRVVTMRAWHARHAVDLESPANSDADDPDYPGPGRVANALWGGPPAAAWAERKVAELEREAQQDDARGRTEPEEEESSIMERRDLSGPAWSPRQAALYDVLEQVAEVFGPFDTGTGPDGVHYVPAADNPFAGEGIKCSGCAFYQGGGGCELLADDVRVEPEAVCKFWIIPGDDLAADEASEPVQARDLPEDYRPALDDDVPAGRACGNCRYYDETQRREDEALCSRWGEFVRGDYYCGAWADAEAATDDAGYGMKDDEEEDRALVSAAPFAGPALVALVGPPGSGKSTWARAELPDAERVSLEAIRTDDPADRGAVIREAIVRTFALLREGRLVVFDATLIDPAFRRRLRGIGRLLGVPVHAVIFRTPIEKLLAAQDSREAPVPAERVQQLYEEFQAQYAAIPGEGWASVTTVSREGSQERSRAQEFAELRDRLAGESRSLQVSVTETRAIPTDDGGYVIEGHAAVFDSSSYPLPDGRGGTFIEQVKRGAFRRALADPEGPTVALINHDPNLVLASTGAQPPTLELWEDPKGLRIRARVAPTSYAEDLRVLMERGDVSGMSFGFTVESDRWWQDAQGRTRRDIQRIGRLTDISVVTSPAYGAPSSAITSRGATGPEEEGQEPSDPMGEHPLAASATTRRRRLEMLELTSARHPNKEIT